MKNSLLAFAASSAEELENKITTSLKENPSKSRLTTLAIGGPQVLICPFNLEKMSSKELLAHLRSEAVGMLSLPLDQIVMDYQILSGEDETVAGIYTCLPKSSLDGYLAVLNNAKLIPVKITTYFLATIDSFFRQHETKNERFCLIDFSKETNINLAIFMDHQCELIRQIPYDDDNEAKNEVIQSLRSACSKSRNKQFDNIYFYGHLTNKENLILEIEKVFNTKTTRYHSMDVSSLTTQDNFFTINLLKEHAFSLQERRLIFLAVHAVLLIVLLVNIGLGIKLFEINKNITDIKSSYNDSEYSYALSLQEQVNAQHGKK